MEFYSKQNTQAIKTYLLEQVQSSFGINNLDRISHLIDVGLSNYKLLKFEDIYDLNPVNVVKANNQKFIGDFLANLRYDYDSMFNSDIDPDTGKHIQMATYDYDATSWNTGTWKPEDLFLKSKRNADVGYWQNLNIEFNSSPQATGLGHRYNSKLYGNPYVQYPVSQTNARIDNRTTDAFTEYGNRGVQSNKISYDAEVLMDYPSGWPSIKGNISNLVERS
jgi:hypothetical protein